MNCYLFLYLKRDLFWFHNLTLRNLNGQHSVLKGRLDLLNIERIRQCKDPGQLPFIALTAEIRSLFLLLLLLLYRGIFLALPSFI